MPTIAYEDSHPYAKDHSYNTMIEFEFDGCILWALQQSAEMRREDIELAPGDVHVATVRITGDGRLHEMHRIEKRRNQDDGGLSRHHAQFALSEQPGRYVFYARYHPNGLAKNATAAALPRVDNGLDWKGKVLRSNRTELKIVARQPAETVERLDRDGGS